jgi:hypothetical protein
MSRRKLTADELAARGTQPRKVTMRRKEERQARIAAVVKPLPSPAVQIPPEVTDADAIAVFQHVAKHFKLDTLGKIMLTQCVLSLQRANELRCAIDGHGDMREVPRHLLSAERDARMLYQRLSEKLGL